uniref:Uncharacterized protein n=1 Tax=Arundo donax TaxID=35708 RepID=A0A0A9B9Y1_ARUDO
MYNLNCLLLLNISNSPYRFRAN